MIVMLVLLVLALLYSAVFPHAPEHTTWEPFHRSVTEQRVADEQERGEAP